MRHEEISVRNAILEFSTPGDEQRGPNRRTVSRGHGGEAGPAPSVSTWAKGNSRRGTPNHANFLVGKSAPNLAIST